MKNQRFRLKSYNFNDLNAVIYDELEKKELHLSIHGIIQLLNKVSQKEYSLLNLKKDICSKIDEAMKYE